MNPNEPQWYRRLVSGPFRQEPQPTSIQLQSIKEGVANVRNKHWYWKASTAVLVISFSVFILYTWVFPSMEQRASGPEENSNVYSGIEKNDIPDISNAHNIEFAYEYKGQSNKWAAVYVVYKMKDNNKGITKLLLKYIGEKPNPTGQINFAFDSGNDVRSGTMSFIDEPKDGIYYLGSFPTGTEAVLYKDVIVKLQINWNAYSEKLELKP